jgi:hypothetical protein
MKIEIKSLAGSLLFEGDFSSLAEAVVSAVKKGADLGGANLRDADLGGANLRGADLGGANLGGAKGLDRTRTQPLMMLLDQPGAIRAYKLVTSELESPIAPENGHGKLSTK